jgi:hypothetical protein
MKPLTKEGMLDIVKTLQKALPPTEATMNETHVDDMFNLLWSEFEKEITNLPDEEAAPPPKRKLEDMIEELLSLVRGLERAKPDPIAKWGRDIGSAALDIALRNGNHLDPQITSGSVSVREGDVLVQLKSSAGKVYEITIPGSTPTFAYESYIQESLKRQIGSPLGLIAVPPPPMIGSK